MILQNQPGSANWNDNNKGLTMIEALVAMAVFTIGFLAVGTMIISSTRNNTTGNIITHATMLARERIEFLKSLPIEKMKVQCSDDLEPQRLAGIFDRTCEVDTSFSSTANIVEVKVSWQQDGKHREVVLKTLTRGNGT
jgi:prepilin-type N-terminal cleavage/methylation domain-containing protein